MVWARMLAYITGTVDQELLLRNEYLAAENRCGSSKLNAAVFFRRNTCFCE
jgi:putative transposase